MHTIPLAVSEQQVSPGVLGFVVVALLGLALFLLIRSMNKQMRKINFDDGSGDPAPHAPADEGGRRPSAEAKESKAPAEPAAAGGGEEKNAPES